MNKNTYTNIYMNKYTCTNGKLWKLQMGSYGKFLYKWEVMERNEGLKSF